MAGREEPAKLLVEKDESIGQKSKRPGWFKRILKQQHREFVQMKKEARLIYKNENQMIQILREFSAWFTYAAESIHCTFTLIDSPFSFESAMDLFDDLEVTWNDLEKHVIYQAIVNHGDKEFTFCNLATFTDQIKSGIIKLPGLGIKKLCIDEAVVLVYALKASIPYNTLNMTFKLPIKTNLLQVKHLVRYANDWPSNKIQLYTTKTCTEEVDEKTTLEDMLMKKEALTFYMDFDIGYVDNPLVYTDDYFKYRTVDTKGD